MESTERLQTATTLSRNPLREFDIGPQWSLQFFLQREGGFDNEVGFVCWDSRIITNKRHLAVRAQFEFKFVAKRDSLQDGKDLVITVRPLTQNL